MLLNKAVSIRLNELLTERNMTPYKLYSKTGVTRGTISNILRCRNKSLNLRVLHEICQGLDINIVDFFTSPLFDNENLDP
nr:helix-turn-helix transcriptional regulator [Clostridia bacterium]